MQVAQKNAIAMSHMAQELVGSEILRIAGEIARMTADGIKVANYTVGDYDPRQFPIPAELTDLIIEMYRKGETNYPPSLGMPELRKAVTEFYKRELNLSYTTQEVLISGGVRPLIYSTFVTLLDPGDLVVYGVPSWNNNHYSHMAGALPIEVRTTAQHNFMLTAEELAPHIGQARLVVLNSPLNPTGTVYSAALLKPLCDMIMAENARRMPRGDKPCYLLYDQIYWKQTYGTPHVHPLALVPEMKPYTFYLDGVSKYLAGTGLRVGWALGPETVMKKMTAVMGHIGAWAPRAEQLAVAAYLGKTESLHTFVQQMNAKMHGRLDRVHTGLKALLQQGLPVDCVVPQGAIYLAAQFNVLGYKTAEGRVLTTTENLRSYLLEDARVGLVPFQAFGVKDNTDWFRMSLGAIPDADIDTSLVSLERSLRKLKAL